MMSVAIAEQCNDESGVNDLGKDELHAAVLSVPAVSRTVILDSCFSGAMAKSMTRLPGTSLRYYARRAGVVFPAGRSHGLHSLRGALAVAMLQTDTPPPVVTAVLGHAAARTTAAHYLRLDTEHLRRCALDVEDVLDSGQGARS